MNSKRLFCLKRAFLIICITLFLINLHIVLNNPNTLQNIFDNGIGIRTSSFSKTSSEYIPMIRKIVKENDTGNSNFDLDFGLV